jgi:hypothetical protein
MPRGGAVTLVDVREPQLSIVCERCGRYGASATRALRDFLGDRVPGLPLLGPNRPQGSKLRWVIESSGVEGYELRIARGLLEHRAPANGAKGACYFVAAARCQLMPSQHARHLDLVRRQRELRRVSRACHTLALAAIAMKGKNGRCRGFVAYGAALAAALETLRHVACSLTPVNWPPLRASRHSRQMVQHSVAACP